MKSQNGTKGRKLVKAHVFVQDSLRLWEDGKVSKEIFFDSYEERANFGYSILAKMPALEVAKNPNLVKLAKMILAVQES